MRLIFTLFLALSAEAQVITLERTVCYGPCPVYTLRIDSTGTVSYHGGTYVAAVGDRTGKIDPAKFQDLLQQFQKIGFFQLRDEYTAMITDMPTTFIGLTQDGKAKRIRDYYKAPPELTELEHSVDRAANVHQWLHDTTKRHTLNSPDFGPGSQEGEDLTNWGVVHSDAYGFLNPAWTPLMYASVAAESDVVERLLKSGSLIDQADFHGNTALIGAAAAGLIRSDAPANVRLLLANGALVDRTNALGETALMWSAKGGNPDVITLLLKSGANHHKTDNSVTMLSTI